MRWFPWWNRAIKRHRQDHFSSPTLFSRRLSSVHRPHIHHDIMVMENTRARWHVEWKQTAELKSSRGNQVEFFSLRVCSALYLHSAPFSPPPRWPWSEKGDVTLECRPAWIRASCDLVRTEQNQTGIYLVDKGRSKGRARSPDINLRHIYGSLFFSFFHAW